MSVSSKKIEDISELIDEGPQLSSFQKLLKLKKLKEKDIDKKLSNLLETKNEKEVIN